MSVSSARRPVPANPFGGRIDPRFRGQAPAPLGAFVRSADPREGSSGLTARPRSQRQVDEQRQHPAHGGMEAKQHLATRRRNHSDRDVASKVRRLLWWRRSARPSSPCSPTQRAQVYPTSDPVRHDPKAIGGNIPGPRPPVPMRTRRPPGPVPLGAGWARRLPRRRGGCRAARCLRRRAGPESDSQFPRPNGRRRCGSQTIRAGRFDPVQRPLSA